MLFQPSARTDLKPFYSALVIILSVSLSSLTLTACTPSPQSQLDDYRDRVARVLEQDVVEQPLMDIPYQSVRANQLPTASHSLNLLDFLKLNQCELGRTVAKRNSALGKVAAPSQVMHLDRDFFMQAPLCIESLNDSTPNLSEELQTVLDKKLANRMAIWWNAWIGFDEWQAFTSIAAQPIEMGVGSEMHNASPHLSISLQALDFAILQGRKWQQGQWQYDELTMEEQLKRLRYSESLGRWLASIQHLIKTLNETALILDTRFQTKALCINRFDGEKADILFNVFKKYYAGKVQPYLSKVMRYGTQLQSRLEQLSTLAHPPKSHDAWRLKVNKLVKTLENANEKHVKAWQATLSACDLMPASPIKHR